MAVQDYELLLKIRADMAQAVEQLNQVQAALRKTSESASGAGGGLHTMNAESSAAIEKLQALAGYTTKVRVGFHDLRNILVSVFALREIVQFTSSLVDANVEARKIQYTLEQAFGKEGAQQQFQFVVDVSKKLGLSLKDAAEGYAQLATSAQGTGLQTKELQNLFIGLSQAATVLHLSAADVNGVMVQLAQGLSLGKLQMQDIRAIAQHLPGTMTSVSEAARRMGTDFQTAMKEGGLPAVQFLQQFGDVLQERFGKESVEASHSLNAELNTLKTTLFEATTQGNEFADSFAGAIHDLVGALSDPAVKEGLSSVISGLGKIIALTIKAGGEVAHLASEFSQGLGISIAQIVTGTTDPNDQLEQERAVLKDINSQIAELQYRKDAAAETKNVPGWLNRLTGVDDAAALRDVDKKLANLRLQQKTAQDAIHNLLTHPQSYVSGSSKGPQAPILGKVIPTQEGPDKSAIAAARKTAREAAAAQKDLTQSLIDLQGQLDPTAAIWAKYNAAVEKANDDAAKAKLAHGANAQAIDAQKNAVIQLAAQVRDAALDKQAEHAREAWESLKRSFESPAQIAVDDALKKIAKLNDLLKRGVITQAQYHQGLADIGKTSVNKAPQYEGPSAVVSGAFGDLQKNTEALAKLNAWHDAVLAANAGFHAKNEAEEEAYQARMAAIQQTYSEQRVQIEKVRGLLTLQAAQEAFGQLTALTSSNNKTLAAIGRVAAILQAGYSLAINVSKASEVGFPLNIGFIAGALAQGAQIYGLISQAGSGAGYLVGGYTGNAPITAIAGVVHGKEGVLSAPEVSALGGEAGFNALRQAIHNGFMDGGYVNPLASAPSPAQLGFISMPQPRLRVPAQPHGSNTKSHPQDIKVVVLLDKNDLADEMMNSPVGQKVILQTVGNNPRAIQGKWQS